MRDHHEHECAMLEDIPRNAPPADMSNFTQVSVNEDTSCVLKTDGSAQCWGVNDLGQTSVPISTMIMGSLAPSGQFKRIVHFSTA